MVVLGQGPGPEAPSGSPRPTSTSGTAVGRDGGTSHFQWIFGIVWKLNVNADHTF